jgi:hypothetical protein
MQCLLCVFHRAWMPYARLAHVCVVCVAASACGHAEQPGLALQRLPDVHHPHGHLEQQAACRNHCSQCSSRYVTHAPATDSAGKGALQDTRCGWVVPRHSALVVSPNHAISHHLCAPVPVLERCISTGSVAFFGCELLQYRLPTTVQTMYSAVSLPLRIIPAC